MHCQNRVVFAHDDPGMLVVFPPRCIRENPDILRVSFGISACVLVCPSHPRHHVPVCGGHPTCQRRGFDHRAFEGTTRHPAWRRAARGSDVLRLSRSRRLHRNAVARIIYTRARGGVWSIDCQFLERQGRRACGRYIRSIAGCPHLGPVVWHHIQGKPSRADKSADEAGFNRIGGGPGRVHNTLFDPNCVLPLAVEGAGPIERNNRRQARQTYRGMICRALPEIPGHRTEGGSTRSCKSSLVLPVYAPLTRGPRGEGKPPYFAAATIQHTR